MAKIPRVLKYLFAICVLAGLGGRSPTFGQVPSPDTIVAKFSEKVGTGSLYIGDNYIHKELKIVQSIKNGIVTKRDEELCLIKKERGGPYKELISRNGISATRSQF